MSTGGILAPSEVLAQTSFFRELDPVRLDRIAGLVDLQQRAEGEVVYRHGEHAEHVYVLARGLARMSLGYHGRNASAADMLRRADVFGWGALAPCGRVRIATVTCLTPCTLLSLDGASLLLLMEQDHTLGYRLMTQLTLLITTTLSAFAGS